MSGPEPSSRRAPLAGARRELALRAGAGLYRPVRGLLERWRRFWWAAHLRAAVRSVGPRVYVYGPVRVLGTRDVWLGGDGNLYDGVLFETVDAGAIRVGDDFRINRGSLLSAHAGITIGDHCLIAEYVSIRDSNHAFDDPQRPIAEQGFTASPIVVEDDVWIGRGAVVLAGVTIGRGAVVAANSVVTKSVPPMEVWAGVPARLIRRRGEAKPK